MFFTSKGGYIYNAAIDWETGKITDFKSLALKDAEGYTSEEKPGAIMSTCTPSVYNGRIYSAFPAARASSPRTAATASRSLIWILQLAK